MKKMAQLLNDIGNKIREIREMRRLTIDECAQKSEMTRTYLNQIELGQVNTSISKLESIAHALGVHVSELLIQSQSSPKPEEELIQLLCQNKSKRDLQCVIALLRAMG